jgi:NADH:ubiquinone oxidoreductase subunit 3 (subunit A)
VSLDAIMLLAVIVLAFGVLMLFLTSKVGPQKTLNPIKMMPYECGIIGTEKSPSSFI